MIIKVVHDWDVRVVLLWSAIHNTLVVKKVQVPAPLLTNKCYMHGYMQVSVGPNVEFLTVRYKGHKRSVYSHFNSNIWITAQSFGEWKNDKFLWNGCVSHHCVLFQCLRRLVPHSMNCAWTLSLYGIAVWSSKLIFCAGHLHLQGKLWLRLYQSGFSVPNLRFTWPQNKPKLSCIHLHTWYWGYIVLKQSSCFGFPQTNCYTSC